MGSCGRILTYITISGALIALATAVCPVPSAPFRAPTSAHPTPPAPRGGPDPTRAPATTRTSSTTPGAGRRTPTRCWTKNGRRTLLLVLLGRPRPPPPPPPRRRRRRRRRRRCIHHHRGRRVRRVSPVQSRRRCPSGTGSMKTDCRSIGPHRGRRRGARGGGRGKMPVALHGGPRTNDIE